MTLGADRKKLGILGGLLLVAAYFFYSNVIATDDGPPPSPRSPAVRPATAPLPRDPIARVSTAEPGRRPGGRTSFNQEFRPKFKVNKPGEASDLVNTDPTLRLDLLTKIRDVRIEGGERNLFQFGAAPVPKAPDPRIVPKPAAGQVAQANSPNGTPQAAAAKPPAPPIPLKFYGYTNAGKLKRAFFLDGEDVIVATEGELIKKRYKVVGIGINSVVMEDVQEKHQQVLPLEEQAG